MKSTASVEDINKDHEVGRGKSKYHPRSQMQTIISWMERDMEQRQKDKGEPIPGGGRIDISEATRLLC